MVANSTMTVGELISKLQDLPTGTEVFISQGGITFCPILGILMQTNSKDRVWIVGTEMRIGTKNSC